MGFARVSSTERRRADIKSGHFIARSTRSLTRATRVGLRQSGLGPPAPLDSRHNRADDLRDCENAALDAVSTVNSRFIPQKLNSLLSHRRHLIRPNVGIRFLKFSATHPVVALCPLSASTSRRVLRSVPDRVRALCGTAPTCCEHPASRVERGMAVTRHTLMDTLDKIPPSSLTDSTHTQLACRKGRVHSSPDLHA